MPQEKGKSHPTRPVSKRAPVWCKYTPEEVESIVIKLAKEGYPSSQIGIILRDQHGVPLTKPIIGKTITQVLKSVGLAPAIPSDMENLLRKASRLYVHMEKNAKDAYNKRSLQLVEAKIRKLVKYYKQQKKLPAEWKYETKVAHVV